MPVVSHHVMESPSPKQRRSKGRSPAQRESALQAGLYRKRKLEEVETTCPPEPLISLESTLTTLSLCQRREKRWRHTAETARGQAEEKEAQLSVAQEALEASESSLEATQEAIEDICQQLEAALCREAQLVAQQQQHLASQDDLKKIFQSEVLAVSQSSYSRISELEGMVHRLQAENQELQTNLVNTLHKLSAKVVDATQLYEQTRALEKQVHRIPGRLGLARGKGQEQSQARTRAICMKEKGVISEKWRSLVRFLLDHKIGAEHIDAVIHKVVHVATGQEVEDHVSARQAGRMNAEGLLHAKLQAGVAIAESTSEQRVRPILCRTDSVTEFVSYNDGTTIKGQNHEARYVGVQAKDQPAILSLGVHRTVNHKAETQFSGFRGQLRELADLVNQSPIGGKYLLNEVEIARRWGGGVTDHAPDQKKFVKLTKDYKWQTDRYTRGQEMYRLMSEEDRQTLMANALSIAQRTKRWKKSTEDEQNEVFRTALRQRICEVGDDLFKKLDPAVQRVIDLYLWHGCMMHKDLNATKGGDAAMKAAWEKLGLLPMPILLKNKWQKQQASAGLTDRAAADEEEDDDHGPIGGGTKLCSISGAEYNSSDPKKGLHRIHRDYLKSKLGHAVVFPDTSNTRYGAYCAAAAELLVNLQLYIDMMELLNHVKKDGLNSMEQNILAGLQDWSTLTELAVLAIYGQALSIPYVKFVRSYEGNSLNLGPFHEEFKAHLRRLIADPELLLNPQTALSDAIFHGQRPERPEVFSTIFKMMAGMPHLRVLLVAYLQGALETMERFTEEFAVGGDIDKATPEERDLVASLTTNDISESALGVSRQAKLANPTQTDDQRNSGVMRRYNGTEAWKDKHLDPETLKWARQYVRAHEGESEKALQAEAAAYFEQTGHEGEEADKKRKKAAADKKARLEAARLCIDAIALKSFTVADLETQIDKWRILDIRTIPKSNLKVKNKLIAEILAVVARAKVEGKLDGFLQRDLAAGERKEAGTSRVAGAVQSGGDIDMDVGGA
jgi:hypothetical protein